MYSRASAMRLSTRGTGIPVTREISGTTGARANAARAATDRPSAAARTRAARVARPPRNARHARPRAMVHLGTPGADGGAQRPAAHLGGIQLSGELDEPWQERLVRRRRAQAAAWRAPTSPEQQLGLAQVPSDRETRAPQGESMAWMSCFSAVRSPRCALLRSSGSLPGSVQGRVDGVSKPILPRWAYWRRGSGGAGAISFTLFSAGPARTEAPFSELRSRWPRAPPGGCEPARGGPFIDSQPGGRTL